MRSKSTMTTATLHGEKGWGYIWPRIFWKKKKRNHPVLLFLQALINSLSDVEEGTQLPYGIRV